MFNIFTIIMYILRVHLGDAKIDPKGKWIYDSCSTSIDDHWQQPKKKRRKKTSRSNHQTIRLENIYVIPLSLYLTNRCYKKKTTNRYLLDPIILSFNDNNFDLLNLYIFLFFVFVSIIPKTLFFVWKLFNIQFVSNKFISIHFFFFFFEFLNFRWKWIN